MKISVFFATFDSDLLNEEYTFGRGEECDYCFENHSHGKKLPQYLALSKTHFRVYRVCTRVCDSVVGGWVWSDSGVGVV